MERMNPDEIEVMFIDWKRGIDFNIVDIDFQDVLCVRGTLTDIAIKSPELVRAIFTIAKTIVAAVDEDSRAFKEVTGEKLEHDSED